MKIATRDVKSFVAKPQSALGTLIYGPDSGQVLAYAREVIGQLLGEHYDPLNLVELDDAALKEDSTKLHDECSAMSLMGGKRVVWLRDVSEKYAPLIESCIPLLSEDCYVLVTAGECGPRHKLRQLFEQHKELAALACYRAQGQNLSHMIRETMSSHGLNIDMDALQFLTQELGNDAMITRSELEKLSLYAHDQNTVKLDDAKAVTIHNHDHRIDPLCQYFIEGNQPKFDQLWQYLLRDGEQPIVLLRSLMRHTGRLLSLKLAMQEEGFSAAEAVKFARPPIFWNQKDSFTRALNQHSMRKFVYDLYLLNQAELAIKSHSAMGPIVALQSLEKAI